MIKVKTIISRFWEKDPILYTALTVAGIMFYPVGLIHESGHAMICTSNNGTFSLIEFFLLEVNCRPYLPADVLLTYWSFGGIFGMIASLPVLLWKTARSNKGVFIGVSTIVFSQLVNFLFETFAHNAYLQNPVLAVLGIIVILLFFLSMLRFFSPRAKGKTKPSYK